MIVKDSNDDLRIKVWTGIPTAAVEFYGNIEAENKILPFWAYFYDPVKKLVYMTVENSELMFFVGQDFVSPTNKFYKSGKKKGRTRGHWTKLFSKLPVPPDFTAITVPNGATINSLKENMMTFDEFCTAKNIVTTKKRFKKWLDRSKIYDDSPKSQNEWQAALLESIQHP